MNELSGILRESTAAVGSGYFQLRIDGGNPVFRERVYCYELYHQMRKNWPDDCRYHLNGELDKSAHPILSELGAGSAKPDFLVHTPGAMDGNYAIIEVKHSIVVAGVRKDLKTLDLFVRKVEYQKAIYLIYGGEANAAGVEIIQNVAKEFPVLAPIEVWLHSEVNQPAEHYTTLQKFPKAGLKPSAQE
jgi:hypothetical protein